MALMCGSARWFRTSFAQYSFDENSDARNEAAQTQIVTRLQSEDGKHSLEIERLPSGLFRYIEWAEAFDYHDDQIYLSPSHYSGLYSSAEDAQLDARRAFEWLTDQPARDAL